MDLSSNTSSVVLTPEDTSSSCSSALLPAAAVAVASVAAVDALYQEIHEESEDHKSHHSFWNLQPVKQYTQDDETLSGPVKDLSDFSIEDPDAAPGLEWWSPHIKQDEEEDLLQIYRFLNEHYVTGDNYRFDYQPHLLKWALCPPGHRREWHLALRSRDTQKIVGFISAIPSTLGLHDQLLRVVEINFLCVHQEHRDQKLAPLLISKITHLVKQVGIAQAVFTAAVELPAPLGEAQYFHRPLNPKKLFDIGFSYPIPKLTLSENFRWYKVRHAPWNDDFRPLRLADVDQALELLTSELETMKMAPRFSREEFMYRFLEDRTPAGDDDPKVEIKDDCSARVNSATRNVYAYVIAHPETGKITDFSSFYVVPATIYGNDKHSAMVVAFSFYHVARTVSIEKLLRDTLIQAKNEANADVFNALHAGKLADRKLLRQLKFQAGTGMLRYYVFNWRCPAVDNEGIALELIG